MHKILPFNDLILFFNLQIRQKYNQGFLPSAFGSVWLTNQERREGDILQHPPQRILRNSKNLNIPFARLTFSFNQPYINLPRTWISFNVENIKIIRNKAEFNIKLKNYLLSLLTNSVQCGRLLCPVCHLIP